MQLITCRSFLWKKLLGLAAAQPNQLSQLLELLNTARRQREHQDEGTK